MRFSLGQEIDGLEVVRVLRPSGRSVAYIVRDVITQRLEHLKLVPDSVQQDDPSRQRFLREAKLHASLSHPNIARFYSVRRIDGELVMTREWVDGESLASKLKAGPLPIPQAVDYTAQALLALQYAHGQGVIHRDFSPKSLLITASGVIKLTGFDLARSIADPRLTGTGVVLGSVHYMAPEQVKGLGEADERSDLYACGVTLFEAVTGQRPYTGKSDFDIMLAHVEVPAPSPQQWNELVSPGLDAAIRKALAKDPAERFQSAGAFRQALLDDAESEVRRTLTPASSFESAPETAASTAALELEPQPSLLPPLPPPADAWKQDPGDISRMLGIAIAGFSVGILLFLAGMILLNS